MVVSVYVSVSRRFGEAHVVDLRTGETVSVTLATGEVIEARLSGDAKEDFFGKKPAAYSRRQKDNQEIIDVFLKTFKTY